MIEFAEIKENEWRKLEDEINKYDSKTLFHESCWLEYLKSTGKGTPKYLEIRSGNTIVGYFIFLEVKIGPFRIMGSPLPGWTTNFMGPLFNKDQDQYELVEALIRYIRKKGYIYTEIKNEIINLHIMQKCGFEINFKETAVTLIDKDEETLWRKINSTCRNRVRKAINNDLEIEQADDINIISEYYQMIVNRYAQQGMSFPFSIGRLETLWACLKPKMKLLTVRVKKAGETIAAGIFPHDGRCIYYFGGASKPEANLYCPNELLHWSVLRYAQKVGIAKYNLCGTSQFKRKFGSSDIPYIGYSYSPIPRFKTVRNILYRIHWKRLEIRHRIATFFQETTKCEHEN